MKLWLFRRSGAAGGAGSATAAAGRPSGIAMTIGSLEHMVRNRVRMFLRHTWLVTILGTVVLGACLWAGVHYSTEATVMRIAAGPIEGSNVKFVQVLTKTIDDNRAPLRLQLVATDGPAASARALVGRQADLAIVPATLGDSLAWPVIAILRQNVMAFIVPTPQPAPPATTPAASTSAPAKKATAAKASTGAKSKKPAKAAKKSDTAAAADSDASDDSSDADAGKLKVSQLAGKRIGIVTGNEATADLLNVVLDHYGVPRDKVQVSQIDPAAVPGAIKSNSVDVLFVAGVATGQAIGNAVVAATRNGTAPTFIEIDQADGIAKRVPAFDSTDIDAGTFGGNPPTPDDSLKTLSFPEYLVARKSFSHSAIAELAKTIYTSRLALASQMAGAVKIEAPSTDKDAGVVVHPGALDYLNDNEKTFFDRYGDDIFYGMLIFPVFGSAIAALAGYLRRDSRTRRLRLLQRVLDLVRKVHAAQTLEAIGHLQVEADNLVIAIIHLSEHEEFDESVRMSFAFALDQLRFAIAARRTAIVDHAGGAGETGGETPAGAPAAPAESGAKAVAA